MKKLILIVLVFLAAFAAAPAHSQNKVGFEKTLYQGCPPFTITFKDTFNVASSYLFWVSVRIDGIDNLIDTFTSGNNTRYTFTQPGYYSLAMWGHDSAGNFIGFDGPDVYAYGRYEIKPSSDTLCPNEEVTFEDKFYDGKHYFWDFGDGDTVTGSKVKHVYASKGEYTVTEKITTHCGYDTIISKKIIVNDSKEPSEPYFYFISEDYYGYTSISAACPTEPLVFYAQYTDPDTKLYRWDFGDGVIETTSSKMAHHTYSTIGTFTITLTTINNCDNTSSRTASIVILDTTTPEIHSFDMVEDVQCPNADIHFYNWGNTGPNLRWDFGDGTFDTGNAPRHRFTTLGQHIVTFTATNRCGNIASYSDTVFIVDTLAPDKPTFDPYPNEACSGDKILMWYRSYADTSSGINHNLSYYWDFGDGSTGTGINSFHTYHDTGTFTIRCTATNTCGNSTPFTNTVHITTTAIPPINFNVQSPSHSIGTLCPGDTIRFLPYAYGYWFVPPPPFEAYSYHWDFGDGTSDTSRSPGHPYLQYGNYKVIFTVTNHCGNSSRDSTIIKVDSNGKKYAYIYWSGEDIFDRTRVHTNDTVRFYSLGGITHRWDFGDGTVITTNDDSLTHVYKTSGSFTVTLTSYDNCGQSASASYSITVERKNILTAPQVVDKGMPVISIYPNPFRSIFTMKVTEDIKDASLQVFDMLGRSVLRKHITRPESEIDLSSQPDGMYFLTLNSERGSFSQKIVKE